MFKDAGAVRIRLLFRRIGRDVTDEECEALYLREHSIFKELPDVSPMRALIG